ncbi:MAG: type VI secretion system baseplate subunit TssE [Candidatus Krumholzibacteriia bacterium]
MRHSVLDRLAATGGGSRQRDLRIGVEELKQSVRRDIEWLLNSRRPLLDLADLPEARASILAYGMPDLTGFSSSQADRQRICAHIETALRTFEPRLLPRSIKVEPVTGREEGYARLKFSIHALLDVDPVREPISFDTSVETSSGAVQVRTGD